MYSRYCIVQFLILALGAGFAVSVHAQAEKAVTFPAEELPPYIRKVAHLGQRAEWSHDGERIMYVTRAGGEVYELDLESGESRPLTLHYERPEGWGYYRALYLPNGDYLLTGGPSRKEAYLQIMDSSLEEPPIVTDEVIAEGPALSRRDYTIAWTPEQDQIWLGKLEIGDGTVQIVDRKLIIDNTDVVVDGIRYEGMVEPQNFRPPHDDELIWSQYGHDARGVFTSEVMGYDLDTGEMTNYSKAPGQYDEPEGIFPGGAYTLVESDRHDPMGTANIDIYRLRLDGTGEDYERLTFFNEVEGFRSSNPAVSDDGRYIVFQESISGSAPGAGQGLYIMDLKAAGWLDD